MLTRNKIKLELEKARKSNRIWKKTKKQEELDAEAILKFKQERESKYLKKQSTHIFNYYSSETIASETNTHDDMQSKLEEEEQAIRDKADLLIFGAHLAELHELNEKFMNKLKPYEKKFFEKGLKESEIEHNKGIQNLLSGLHVSDKAEKISAKCDKVVEKMRNNFVKFSLRFDESHAGPNFLRSLLNLRLEELEIFRYVQHDLQNGTLPVPVRTMIRQQHYMVRQFFALAPIIESAVAKKIEDFQPANADLKSLELQLEKCSYSRSPYHTLIIKGDDKSRIKFLRSYAKYLTLREKMQLTKEYRRNLKRKNRM